MTNAVGRPIAPLVLSSDERAYLERQVRRRRLDGMTVAKANTKVEDTGSLTSGSSVFVGSTVEKGRRWEGTAVTPIV